MTGVCPRGAQVRRVTGNSEAPDSSQNTITARRRRAFARILGPDLAHPVGEGPLVAFNGAAGGALQAVVQPVAQQLPYVAGMVGDPGQLFDNGGDSGRGQVGVGPSERRGAEPVGPALRSASGPPARQRACQRLTFCRATPRARATSAWERPAANNWPGSLRPPSDGGGSRRTRAVG